MTKHYIEGLRIGLPPGTVAVYFASEVDAEIAALRDQLAEVRQLHNELCPVCAEARKQLAAAKAEVERLRGALRELIVHGRSYMRYHTEKTVGITPTLDRAERALEKP